jgi:hypothetical protein
MLHCSVSFVAYNMFHMLQEIMSMLMIKELHEFIYVKLLKQVQFC